ncbi:hypothetical protein CFSAN001690_02955 [Salmonella enterica subsp. enterica serovar Cerro str. CFSAN001690]|nr:hypothetical protein CFSAN002069_24570 [Salmonella enterica subsp. enterica serovar Heidelberg str. CFSAN002069]AHU95021.1 hypothetical protein AU17_18195 [Salmonella enterica subsp. enterica serovar Enteritidis str. EC20110354]AHW21034.1 hypothetical protein CFSAN000658_04460 [Salmonella enterica subsp. enterica serovar Abaetetuba str. ATCC 35640]ETB84425.1 hypothetical protein CFSAN004343_12980 [Salmonella enterica subsp. enterica serovar Give var. 15 str. CFSAN004343]ETB90991.1 hypothetic
MPHIVAWESISLGLLVGLIHSNTFYFSRS